MSVFVTVGTTKFEYLIRYVDTDEVRQALLEQGYTKIVCQIGSGEFIPQHEYFRYAPSLENYILSADLIISHAGSGSILEALRNQKKLIVVVNQLLMDNHQLEIAQELSSRSHLIMCQDPTQLNQSIRKLKSTNLEPLPPSNTETLNVEILSLLRN